MMTIIGEIFYCLAMQLMIFGCCVLKYIRYKEEHIKMDMSFILMSIFSICYESFSLCYAYKLKAPVAHLKDVSTVYKIGEFFLVLTLAFICDYMAELLYKEHSRMKLHFVYVSIVLAICFSIPFVPCALHQGPRYIGGDILTFEYCIWGLYALVLVIFSAIKVRNVKRHSKVGAFFMIVITILCLYQEAHDPIARGYDLCLTLTIGMLFISSSNPDFTRLDKALKNIEIEKESNKAKTLFVSQISHELRTPMNVILGMSDILSTTELNEEQTKYLDNIQKSGNALLLIINDILDYSKMESDKLSLLPAPYDVRELLNDVYLMIQTRIGSKPINLIFDIDSNLPKQLIGDEVRVRQILINLLNNAVKYTQEGEVSLSISSEDMVNGKTRVNLDVSDTGQGIKEEDKHKLFKAFGQVDAEKNKNIEGTGLGLAIVKKLLDMMDGSVTVTSEYGVGSTFSITFVQEIPEKEVVLTKTKNVTGMFKAPSARVMIVDDNHLNLEVAKGLAAQLQIKTMTIDNGKDALETLINDKDFDIVFMDRMMPGISGEEATRLIRENGITIPIIAMTADLTEESKVGMRKAGCDDFIAKPIDSKLALAVVKKYLPDEKLIKVNDMPIAKENKGRLHINEVNESEGIGLCGGEQLYYQLIKEFAESSLDNVCTFMKYLDTGDINNFTILVHSLKSNSRSLGIKSLGNMFEDLEFNGKANDIDYLKVQTPRVVAEYRKISEKIKSAFPKEQQTEFSAEKILSYLSELREAIDSCDLDAADGIFAELSKGISDSDRVALSSIVTNMDVDRLDEFTNITKRESPRF